MKHDLISGARRHASGGANGLARLEQPIELTTAEFDLLVFLAERAGTPASRQEIYIQLL